MNKFLIICLTLLLTSCSDILSTILTTETIYECSGKFAEKSNESETARPARLFFKFTKYRSIVSLWSDSDGSLSTELRPSIWTDYYSHTEIVGDQLQIHQRKKLVGNFSFLSNVVALETYNGVFNGSCIEKK